MALPPDFYQRPSAEAMRAAEGWAKAEVYDPQKYGVRMTTPKGETVQGTILIDPNYYRQLGIIFIPYGYNQQKKEIFNPFQKALLKMAINNQQVFKGGESRQEKPEEIANLLGIRSEKTIFELTTTTSYDINLLKFFRKWSTADWETDNQERGTHSWWKKNRGLSREESHLSVEGLARQLEYVFFGTKLEPMMIDLTGK